MNCAGSALTEPASEAWTVKPKLVSKNVKQRGVGVVDEYRYGFAVHIELSSCHAKPHHSLWAELQSCSRNPAFNSTAYPGSNITIEIISDPCARPNWAPLTAVLR